MQMAPGEFYGMEPRQFFNKQQGFFDHHKFLQREAWERMRFSTTHLINIQLPQNKKIKPVDLVKFEWDRVKTLSQQEFEDFIK